MEKTTRDQVVISPLLYVPFFYTLAIFVPPLSLPYERKKKGFRSYSAIWQGHLRYTTDAIFPGELQ